MQRRTLLQVAIGTVFALTLDFSSVQAANDIKIGVPGPKTGPMAGGAAVTHWPSFRLWAKQVNARGGLNVKGEKRKIKLIEYDDRTDMGETIKAVNRLATQDKADFIMAPYGTGSNLAAAPIFAKYGYPQFAVTAVTDKIDELVKRYPTIFFFLAPSSAYARSVAEVLDKLRKEGKINNRIAMTNVAHTFGIELANAARPVFKKLGFEIVYDKSYPLGTQDLAPVIKAAKASKPDALINWSYPPDTFGLTKQAKIEGLKVKVYYTAVATAFPAFSGAFGKSAENIIGAGGVPNTPAIQKFYKDHKELTGVGADYWGSPVEHAAIQILEQSIKAVGVDRKAVLKHVKSNTFDTIIGKVDMRKQAIPFYWTVGQWQNGFFEGVKGVGIPSAKSVKLKSSW